MSRNYDIILITGAPGSGKSTLAKLIQEHFKSPLFEFGWIPEFRRLDIQQTYEQEEQISFENLLLVSKNYLKHGYKNIIITDLRTHTVNNLLNEIKDLNYLVVTLIADSDDLKVRLEARDEGYKDYKNAESDNQYWESSQIPNQHKIYTGNKSVQEVFKEIVNTYMNKIDNEKLKSWFNKNCPNEQLSEIKELYGGQSNLCYLINQKYVLKIYSPKYDWAKGNQPHHFETAKKYMPLLATTGFTPKIYGIYENDLILESNAVLMEYISGRDLSRLLYTFSEEQKFESGKEVGKLLKSIHTTKALPNQEYDTRKLWEEVNQEYQEALEKGLIYPEVGEFAKKVLNDYRPRIINDNFVLIHGDAHPENFIQTQNGLKIIDLDMCELSLPIIELRMILHAACMPANVVSEDLEKYYPEASLIGWFKGIVAEYPEICPSKYLEEIKLICLYEILGKFNLPETIVDKDTPRKRAMGMFETTFGNSLIEKL